ncbi:MAG: hypothetical protein AAF515_01035 [Pseudomonadota bacterium]
MNCKRWTLCLTLTICWIASGTAFAKERSVKQIRSLDDALSWEVPQSPCEAPKDPRIASGGQNFDPANPQTSSSYDLDHYTLSRFERKMKRWRKCESRYRERLYANGMALQRVAQQASAEQRLTQEQLDVILIKVAQVKLILNPQD